jgi:hypothetical protein
VNVASLVEAVSAGAGSAAVVGTAVSKYWRAREARLKAAFTQAVQNIVDASVTDVIARQAAFEARQGKHLDNQDRAIADLRKLVERVRARQERPGNG